MPTLAPLEGSTLLTFWLQLVLLIGVARALGYVARTLGQPPVVGELGAGVLLGPSVLGQAAPDAFAWLFPGGDLASGLLLAVAWLGVVFLLLTTGFETDLRLIRRLLRSAALVPVGSLVLPLAVGIGLGWAMPVAFHGSSADRPAFAGFMGLALAMSALPVVARILKDMQLLRRDVGQITLFAAMADDIVGWLLLGVLTGAVAGRGIRGDELLFTSIVLVVFLVLAVTVGQRLVDRALRASLQLTDGIAGALTTAVLTALIAAAITQAIGVEAVVGAFLAGILIGRSRYRSTDVNHAIELVSTSILAPVFFATAGLQVDLTTLADPTVAAWSAAVLVGACASKLVGAYVGARSGGTPRGQAWAIGIGLNARGALGIVLATVALSIGVFDPTSYTIVVVMAIVTSMMVPPLLRRALRRVAPTPHEAERLQREAVRRESVVAGVDSALLPTRGGRNSALAARVLHHVLDVDASVTILTVGTDQVSHDAVDELASRLQGRPVHRRRRGEDDPAEGILQEAALAYGLLAIGANDDITTVGGVSTVLQRLLVASPTPILLVRRGRTGPDDPPIRRVLVPSTGRRAGRAAEEVAYALAASTGAEVDVLHVVSRADRVALAAWQGEVNQPVDHGVLTRSLDLAARFGRTVTGFTRHGSGAAETILTTATERGADTIVLAAAATSLGDRAFLGHGVEYLLEHAPQALVLVVFPARL